MPDTQHIKIAVDAIVFAYRAETLYVLLVKQRFGPMAEKWVLPGGFVLDAEPLRVAVQRELLEETGIAVGYLEQLYTFGDDAQRDPRGRVISVAYFALVNPDTFDLVTDTDSDAHQARWFSIGHLPNLGFDHAEMIQFAHQRLQNKIKYQPIGFDLLGDTFLFSEVEQLYTTILARDIDRRNFRKKMLAFGILEESDEIARGGAGRPARKYRFNQLKYNALIEFGFHFEI